MVGWLVVCAWTFGVWCSVPCDLFGSSLFLVLGVLDVGCGCLVTMFVWINRLLGWCYFYCCFNI